MTYGVTPISVLKKNFFKEIFAITKIVFWIINGKGINRKRRAYRNSFSLNLWFSFSEKVFALLKTLEKFIFFKIYKFRMPPVTIVMIVNGMVIYGLNK